MIQVACACDAAYLPHAAAMLRSLYRHAPAAQAHLLHPAGMARAPLDTLSAWSAARGGSLTLHPVDDGRVAHLPAMGRISRVMWYRLFLPELLPAERVLYLDCDIIVRDRIESLLGTDLRGNAIAAVPNVFEPGQRTHAAGLGLVEPAGYFNSGVLLFDLAAWRRDGLARRVMELAASTRLVFPDQDALNATFARRWTRLHARWNCQNSYFYFGNAAQVIGRDELAEATRCPAIVHFEGGELAKPWHYLCKNPFRTEYFEHRADTPWPNQPLEGRTLLNAALRLLPARGVLPALRLVRRIDAQRRRMMGP